MSSNICASFLHLECPPPLSIQFLNFSSKKKGRKRKEKTQDVQNKLKGCSSEKVGCPWQPPPRNTNIISLAKQIKFKRRENIFPFDRVWRVPAVGLCGNTL